MAELATIARPYAEALMKASANGNAATLAGEIRALADVAANPQMRQFADSPKIDAEAGVRSAHRRRRARRPARRSATPRRTCCAR